MKYNILLFQQMLVSRRDPDRLIKNQYVGRIRPGKRIDFANRFHAVRGKRLPETSPSGTDLRGLISYLQYLQNDRQSGKNGSDGLVQETWTWKRFIRHNTWKQYTDIAITWSNK